MNRNYITKLLQKEQSDCYIENKINYLKQAMQFYYLDQWESLKPFPYNDREKFVFQQCLEYLSENKITEQLELDFPVETGIEQIVMEMK